MILNELKNVLNRNEVVINAWLHIPNTWSAEVMASVGWDSVTVDMQHGMADIGTAIQILQLISHMGVVPMVRASWNDPDQIGRFLDAGAYGMIAPMINTREEAERFVGACRYPPLGYRSLGPTRAKQYAGADYAAYANDEILTFAMIETKQAMENMEDIAKVEGLNVLYVGPGDLCNSLIGKAEQDSTDPVVMDAIKQIIAVAKDNNLYCGTHCNSVSYAKLMVELGMNIVTLQTDTVLLRNAANAALTDLRSSL